MRLRNVVHGKVRLQEEGVLHVRNHDSFHVFEIDLDSKYPGMVDWSVDGRTVEFIITADERTMHTRDTEQDTRVIFVADHDLDQWEIMSEARRYTWRIVFYDNSIDEGGSGNE